MPASVVSARSQQQPLPDEGRLGLTRAREGDDAATTALGDRAEGVVILSEHRDHARFQGNTQSKEVPWNSRSRSRSEG